VSRRPTFSPKPWTPDWSVIDDRVALASAEEDRDRWAAVAIKMGKQLSDIQDVPEDSLAAEIAAVDAEARPMPLEHAMDPAGKKRKAKERAVERAEIARTAEALDAFAESELSGSKRRK
jgi:hypothetical protein